MNPLPATQTFATGAANGAACTVSVVIKALNEEANVAAAIESALRAVHALGGEVVLADSCSTDNTIKVASAYPIRIVQLANPAERSCGIGPQLGFQHTLGEYVYLLDGDMQLIPGFLERALAFLAQHPEVAGVGGRVIECNVESLEFRERALRKEPHRAPGVVDRLDCGGLYRRMAIQEVGYLSDRNLHSYEEFDLAVRLRSRGWKLWRVPIDAIDHHGHDLPHYQLLMRRWRSGYICGMGEMLRSATGQRWMRLVWRDQRELRLYLAVLAWWAVLLSTPLWPVPWPLRGSTFVLLALLPFAVMSLRKRSVARGLYSVISWCFNAAGLVRGYVRHRRPAHEPIASRVLREPGDPAPAAVPPANDHSAGRWLRPLPPWPQRS